MPLLRSVARLAVPALLAALLAAAPATAAVHHMFVTSGAHDADLGAWLTQLNGNVGNLTGAAAADGIC